MSEMEKNKQVDNRKCGSAFSDANLTFTDLLKIKAKFGRNINDIFELNPGQSWMFQCSNMKNNRSAFFLQMMLVVQMDLDKDEFKSWVNEVCKSRQALRFAYVHEGMERPHCVELKTRDAEVNFFDLSNVADNDIPFRLKALEAADRLRGFDLENDPLLRINVFDLPGENKHAFIISQPHINSDGTSIGLLIKDIFVNYVLDIDDALKCNKTNVFKKIADFKNTLNIERELDFWEDALEGAPEHVELPGKLNGVGEFEDCIHITDVSEDVQHKLDNVQQKFKVTLFNFLQAAWAVILGRITGNSAVMFGAITSGRDAQVMESMLIPGGFVRALPVCVKLENSMKFSDVAKGVQENFFDSMQNCHCSLDQIKGKLGREKPLFTHILNCHNFSGNENMAGANNSLEGFKILDGTAYDNLAEDFAVYFRNVNGALKLGIGYNASVFTRKTVELYAKTYVQVLEQILMSDGDVEVGAIEVPSVSEFEATSEIKEVKPENGFMTASAKDFFRKLTWEKAANILCAKNLDYEQIQAELNHENEQKTNSAQTPVLLSIVTPFHNVSMELFESTKNSVLNVLQKNWEWIIVLHNTSTIGVQEMQAIFEHYPNVKIIAKNDDVHTPSSPRNTGLEMASGKYVYFLDADDEISEDFLFKALTKMDVEDADIDVVVGRADIDIDVNEVYAVPLQLDFPVAQNGYIVPRDPDSMGKLLYGAPVMLGCKLIRTSVIKENEIRFDEEITLSEDNLFSLECFIKARKICVLGDVTAYTYVQHGDSLLQSMMNKTGFSVDDYLNPVRRISKLALDNNISPGGYIWTMLGMFGAISSNANLEKEKRDELMSKIQKYLLYVKPEQMKSSKTYLTEEFVTNSIQSKEEVERRIRALVEEYNKDVQLKIGPKKVSVTYKNIERLDVDAQERFISGFRKIVDDDKGDLAVAVFVTEENKATVIAKVSVVVSKGISMDKLIDALGGK